MVSHILRRQPQTEKIHHFCYCRFGCYVMSRHNTACRECVARMVAFVHAAVDTLGHIHYHDPAVHRVAYRVCKPFSCRGVACTVCLQHNSFYARCVELVAQSLFCKSRKQVDEHHRGVHVVVGSERAVLHKPVKSLAVEMYAETYLCKRRVVVAFECVEVVGAHFGGTVAAPQVVFKQYGYFLYCRRSGGVD